MAKKTTETKPTNNDNWVFVPVHKSRILRTLDKAILLKVDYDRSTILPLVFKRVKETKDYIFFSLPQDFNANIRVSVQNEKTRRYEHKDYAINVQKLLDECGLDKPFKELETELGEFVGENAQPVEDDLPF